MKWTSWDDQAFENQLTILNWFPGKRCPGASGFKLKDISVNDTERAVTGRDMQRGIRTNPRRLGRKIHNYDYSLPGQLVERLRRALFLMPRTEIKLPLTP
jgi:hypothetical protein